MIDVEVNGGEFVEAIDLHDLSDGHVLVQIVAKHSLVEIGPLADDDGFVYEVQADNSERIGFVEIRVIGLEPGEWIVTSASEQKRTTFVLSCLSFEDSEPEFALALDYEETSSHA